MNVNQNNDGVLWVSVGSPKINKRILIIMSDSQGFLIKSQKL